ncbi:RSP_2648 family PIN domain-containing protein [Parasulfitobacter algicola]|uniref:PIN domain-containing protein n=1 Tax=Parasulfitobacter algicola TaxID=2614809 RepID=A0ABX2IYL8_9RHOB|nr:PIN domain-containing protein [Sulfitobacter algicola]NSX55716.1 PIN domain-containing protein [Sulfitobacter algicola]
MRALLDACVLYPTVMREILLGVAVQSLFQPRWSDRILEEWARAAARIEPAQEQIARGEIALLRANWPDATIPTAPGLEARLWLPDANDIHVLACAIKGSCDTIITMNAKDFPKNILAEEGLNRHDPDGFLRDLWQTHPDQVASVAENVRQQAETLSKQDWPMRKLLKKARLPRLAKALLTA